MEDLKIDEKLDEIIDLIKIPQIPKKVFKPREAAEYLGISYDRLQQLARIGEIRSAMNGSVRLFKIEWLDAWLEKGGTR